VKSTESITPVPSCIAFETEYGLVDLMFDPAGGEWPYTATIAGKVWRFPTMDSAIEWNYRRYRAWKAL